MHMKTELPTINNQKERLRKIERFRKYVSKSIQISANITKKKKYFIYRIFQYCSTVIYCDLMFVLFSFIAFCVCVDLMVVV